MKDELFRKLPGLAFVFLQFGGIAIILLTGPIFADTVFLFLVELLGVLIGIWAVLIMRISNLSILPYLKVGAIFVRKGPYKLIRHPMYLAILITLIPLVISKFSYFRLGVLIVIFIDLIFKLQYEEKILENSFQNYMDYKTKTYRLIPFLY